MSELSGSGFEVFVLRQVPEITMYGSREVARMLTHGRLEAGSELAAMTDTQMTEVRTRTEASEIVFKQLSDAGEITWLDTWPVFCGVEACSAVQDGKVLYFDNNHVTNEGGRVMRHIFEPFLGQ
jgi:hypothetical protein